jgi:hypothetical protein
VQAVVPALSAYEPGAHTVQFEAAPAPASAEAVPTAQSVHDAEPATA